MKKTYRYLGREILVYGMDFLTWRVTIDGSAIYNAETDEEAVYESQEAAKEEAFWFVLALAEDEVTA